MDSLLQLQEKTNQNLKSADVYQNLLAAHPPIVGSKNSFKFRLRRFNAPGLSNLGSTFWGNRYQVTFPSRDSIVRNAWLVFDTVQIDTSTYATSEWAKDRAIKLVKSQRLSAGSSAFYEEELRHTVLGAITKMKDQYTNIHLSLL